MKKHPSASKKAPIMVKENKTLFFALQLIKTLCINEFFKDGKLLTQEEIFMPPEDFHEVILSDEKKEYIFKIICSSICLSYESGGIIKYKLSTPMNEKLHTQLLNSH